MMKKTSAIFIGLIIMVTSCKTGVQPPTADKRPHEFVEFGNKRIDNYYWLNDRKNPEVSAYLQAENEYVKQHFDKKTEKLQKQLLKELQSRIIQDDKTVEYFENGFYYYTRWQNNKDYEIYCRKPHRDSSEKVMLDVNELGRLYEYCDVSNLVVSPDNKFLAYSLDTISRRRYDIKFKNLTNNADQAGVLRDTDGDCVFANDSRTLYYVVRESETLRSFKVFRHYMGQDPSMDAEIWYEDDPTFELEVQRSKSDDYLFINHINTNSTEVRLVRADCPASDFTVFAPRKKDTEYYVDHCNGKFYIRTNEKGKNFCIMTCDTAVYEGNAKVLIPCNDDVLIEDFEVFNNYLVLDERRNGQTCFEVVSLQNGERHLIQFDEEAYSAWIEDNPEPGTDNFRFGYSSLKTPESIIEYNMSSRKKTVLKEDKIPGFDKNKYSVKRIFVDAADGAKVPVSMLYKTGTDLNQPQNMLLYGYGAYGSGEDDGFYSSVFSLVDRGFIYCIAHVRGGNEMGYQWYEQGRKLNKMNTFTDFISVAEYFINQGTTEPEKLYAQGGSAGGLLMGAVANMRPELFNGIIMQVPFVDVVTTMSDPSVPLTTGEYDEWGNPDEEQYYKYMLSYSPYDNIKEQDYPAMFITTGLYDSQVQYWEPAKFTAKLRELKTDDNPLYLLTNMKAGHSGESGRFQRYKETAKIYSFILNMAGYKEEN